MTLGDGPSSSPNRTVADWCQDGVSARLNCATLVTKQERGAQGNAAPAPTRVNPGMRENQKPAEPRRQRCPRCRGSGIYQDSKCRRPR